MAHPDLPVEQAYLDRAYASLDRMRELLLRTAEAGATDISQQAIENWATGRLRTFEDADRGLCFGRIDSEEAADPIYIGRRWVPGAPPPPPLPRPVPARSRCDRLVGRARLQVPQRLEARPPDQGVVQRPDAHVHRVRDTGG